MNENYGKTPDNPIQLNSIVAARLLLDNVVSYKGYHILYHRRGSFQVRSDGPIIDHYEIMCSDNHYDDFFVNIYNETNEWIPPEGYLFEHNLADINFFLSDYELSELNDSAIAVADKFIFKPEWGDAEDLIPNVNLPLLELFMSNSSGVNGFNDEFPYSRIKELNINHRMYTPNRLEEVLSSIKPREKSNFDIE
ncbi:MAG: hypothetical protein WCO44_17715 [Bacteroidota bacterium]